MGRTRLRLPGQLLDAWEDGVAEIQEGFYVCERCGKVKPVDSACGCGGQGHGEGAPAALEGQDPELVRGGGTRLKLVARPEPDEEE
jgi:hypothetical protein